MATESEVKPVKKLTVKECFAELKELAKDVEFDVKFTTKTPLKELQALVQEGRDALAEDADAEESEDSEVGSEVDEASKDEKSTDTKKSDDKSDESADDSEEDEQSDESEDESEKKQAPPLVIPGLRRGEEAHLVLVSGGENRTYSRATHGEHWKTLAKQYHENMNSQRKGCSQLHKR